MVLQIHDRQLYYEVHGEGEPSLVFIHGWMASSAVWREQIPTFARDHKVVVFDLTGYGRSSKPKGQTYGPEVWSDDLDSLIQHLGLVRPVLVGWSMGASIALAYAATHPDSVSKLVLVGATPLLVAPPEVFAYATPPEAAAELGGALGQDFSAGARAFVEMMFSEPGTSQLKDELHVLTQQTTSDIALESVQAAGGADLRPLLSQVGVPTLVLHGEADRVCPVGAGRCLYEGITDTRMETFSGKGHLPFLTDSTAFNDRLAAFVG